MEDTPLEATPQFNQTAPRRKINRRFLYLLAFILLIALLFIGYKILNVGKSSQNAVPTPTPTVFQIPTDTPTPVVSPTPSPSTTPAVSPTGNPVDKTTGLDRSKLSIVVQNGSGEAGVAKKGEDFLVNLGYNVTGTGNADNYNFTNVTIQVKPASSNYLNLLKKDLNEQYTVGSATADLPNSAKEDAIVIIGK